MKNKATNTEMLEESLKQITDLPNASSVLEEKLQGEEGDYDGKVYFIRHAEPACYHSSHYTV